MDKDVSEWLRIIFPKTWEKRVVDMVRQCRKNMGRLVGGLEMNTQQRAAMQMALEALEVSTDWDVGARGKQLQSMKAITALREALSEQAEQEPVAWIEGYPKDFYAEEWFIARTIYGDRVVLKALPENYSYDFTTADGTYMKKENVKRWMQFPDSEFLPPTVAAPVRTKDLTDEEIEDAVGWTMTEQSILDCRAVIAADREKNK